MNKILYSFLFSAVLFVNVFAYDEAEYFQMPSPQELNTLTDGCYSPLHEFICAMQDEDVSVITQAINSAERGWTYKYGESFCGEAEVPGSIDPLYVTWSASTSKEDMLKNVLADIKNMKNVRAKAVQSFLDAGAHVDFPDSYGRTALWWAAERNQPEVMEVLITAGASVNGNGNHIPLDVAVCDGNKEAVECLLAHGANPNIVDEEGDTPLHTAACGRLWLYPSKSPEYKKCYPVKLQDYKDVIDLLINHGALNTIKNNDGLTPSQLARKQQQEFYPEITEFALADHIEKLTTK